MFFSDPFPSSNNVFSPPKCFFDHGKHSHLDLNNNHQMHNSYISSFPPVTQNVMQQQISEGSGFQYCEDRNDLLDSVISGYKRKMVDSKKDGHSKIYTAQGPRDRRVRLSIGIAKKFFCLQELLGFDKASKTLDWLLTKSLTAIMDLIEETNCSSKAQILETIKGRLDEDKDQKKKLVVPKCVDDKKKKTTQKCKARFQGNLTRDQSRVEARARARERTKQKMCGKNLHGQMETQSGYNHNDPRIGVHIQSRNVKPVKRLKLLS